MTNKINSNTTSNSDLVHSDDMLHPPSASPGASRPAQQSSQFSELSRHRQEFVGDKNNFEHRFTSDKKNRKTERSKYEYKSEYQGEGTIYGKFKNEFQKDRWILKSNYREDFDKEKTFFASDVILHQYNQVSERYGFQGEMPKIIERYNVTNEKTLEGIHGLESGSAELMNTFLGKTPNGVNTQHIMDDLGLQATKVEVENQIYQGTGEIGENGEEIQGPLEGACILVHVEPKPSSPQTNLPESTNSSENK